MFILDRMNNYLHLIIQRSEMGKKKFVYITITSLNYTKKYIKKGEAYFFSVQQVTNAKWTTVKDAIKFEFNDMIPLYIKTILIGDD